MPDLSGDILQVIRNRSLDGGVNTHAFATDLADNQAVELQNIDVSSPGIRDVRGGCSLVATGATFGPALALAQFQAVGSDVELLAVFPGATYPAPGHLTLWSWTGGSVWNLRGVLTGFTSATAGIQIVVGVDIASLSGAPYLARVFSNQAVDISYVYNGAALAVTTASEAIPSTGMFPAEYMLNRCFAGGRAGGSRGKVFFSQTGSFGLTGWASTNSLTMGGGNRQVVMAISAFRNQDLIVFLADRLEAIIVSDNTLDTTGASSPFTTWSREVVDKTIGCASFRSVASTGEDLFFVDQYFHVRSLNRTITDNSQGIKSLPISSNLQEYIDRVNPAASEAINAQVFDGKYVVSYPLDAAIECTHTFVWDTVTRSWAGPYIGRFPSKCMTVATLTNPTAVTKYKNPSLYIGAAATAYGTVYRGYDGTTDAGDPIVARETSKRYDGKQLEAPKAFRFIQDIYVASGAQTMMCEARKDGQDWKLLGYIGLAGDSPQLPLTFPFSFGGNGLVRKTFSLEQFDETARDVQFRFTCTATDVMSHYGYSVAYHGKNLPWEVDE